MTKTANFAFRLSVYDREILAHVAKHLDRTQSDALRLLIRGAGKELLTAGSQATVQQAITEPKRRSEHATAK